MDLSVLKLFIEVMRQRNFAAVARDRNVDPSSVSRAIAGLESELGIRLFQRTTRKLSPTEAGQTFFKKVEPLVEEIQQAINITTDVTEQPKGTLRVTASVSFGLQCIIPILPQFEAEYPDLSVHLLLSDTIIDLLTERIDLAIRLGQLEDSTLIAQRLMRTYYRVCASPEYLARSAPLSHPSEVQNHTCLLFPLAGFQTRWIFKDTSGHLTEVAVKGKTVISNAIALQQCAIAGMGVALLPHWLIDKDCQAGTLINVFPQHEVTATDFNTAAWFVYPSRSYVPLKVRAFITFLQQSIAADFNS